LSGNLTGSEIVDVSQAVAMSFTSPLAYSQLTNSFVVIVSGLAYTRNAISFRINGLPVNSTNVDQSVPTQLESYSPVVYTAPDGDVFQVATDGDSRWFLYKYAGSASGTQTTINTGNTTNYSAIAFDGINTFYWVTSTTNVRAFNADTETTTNITVGNAASTGSTRPRLVHSNGYLMWIWTDGTYPTLIELSTGRCVNCTGVAVSTDHANIIQGFHFNPTTRIATIMSYYFTTNVYYKYTSPAIPVLTTGSSTFSSSWPSVSQSPSSFTNRSALNNQNATIVLTSGDGGIMLDSSTLPCVLSNLSASSGWTLTGPLSPTASAYWRPRAVDNLSPTINTTNFPVSISLRLTGVEVTP